MACHWPYNVPVYIESKTLPYTSCSPVDLRLPKRYQVSMPVRIGPGPHPLDQSQPCGLLDLAAPSLGIGRRWEALVERGCLDYLPAVEPRVGLCVAPEIGQRPIPPSLALGLGVRKSGRHTILGLSSG